MAGANLLARVAAMLARWLRRLATRIEASVGVISSPSLVLDALADRFPGAPVPWLQAIAEHLDDGDLPEPADPVAITLRSPSGAHSKVASRPLSHASGRARAAVRFATLKRPDRAPNGFTALRSRPRAALRWLASAGREEPRPELISQGSIGASHRIATPQVPHSLRVSVAPPLRLGESRASTSCPPVSASELPLVERSEADSIRLSVRAAKFDISIAEMPFPTLLDAAFSPALRLSRRNDSAFMPTNAATRCPPDFPGHDPRWPSLPPASMSIDNALPPAVAFSALRDEQRYGSWSA